MNDGLGVIEGEFEALTAVTLGVIVGVSDILGVTLGVSEIVDVALKLIVGLEEGVILGVCVGDDV
jgi:hypothetical protein